MRRGFVKLGAVVAGIAAVGMATVYVAAPGGGEEEVALQAETPAPNAADEEAVVQAGTFQACIPTDLAAPVPTPVKGVPFPNPDEGLTDAERMAKFERLSSEASARMGAWLECLDFSKLDLRSLPRGPSTAFYLSGEPTLADAVAKAELIVVGNATGLDWKRSAGMQVTLSVEQALKGAPVSSVVVRQGAGLSPTEGWASATLVESEADATLLPGDRAVLLLQKFEDQYYVQGFSGWFQVVDGLIKPNFLNAWGASVDAMPEAQFIELLAAAAKDSASP